MISQDVFHSFSIPAFRIKREVIPGRYSSVWFEATDAGYLSLVLYPVLRHRPLGHDRRNRVLTPDDYKTWLAECTSGMSLAQNGERLFASLGCNACHNGPSRLARSQPGAASTAPSCTWPMDQMTLSNEAYLREAILNPSDHVTAGLCSDHAHLPGANQRRRRDRSGGVHQESQFELPRSTNVDASQPSPGHAGRQVPALLARNEHRRQ